jgi:hypothetical protein
MRRAILPVLPVLLILAVFAPAYIQRYGPKTTLWYFPAMVIVVVIGLVAGVIIRGRRDRAARERVLYELWAPCPIRLLLGRLIADGWTVAVPFPIPDRCFDNTCGHDGRDAWAVGYAQRAERLVRLVEDGQAVHADLEPLVTTMYEEARARGVTA